MDLKNNAQKNTILIQYSSIMVQANLEKLVNYISIIPTSLDLQCSLVDLSIKIHKLFV